MTTAVFATVTETSDNHATIKLVAHIHDSNNPANNLPSVEFEVPKEVGEWLTLMGASEKK